MVSGPLELISLGVTMAGSCASLGPAGPQDGVRLVLQRAENAGGNVEGEVAVNKAAKVGVGFVFSAAKGHG